VYVGMWVCKEGDSVSVNVSVGVGVGVGVGIGGCVGAWVCW